MKVDWIMERIDTMRRLLAEGYSSSYVAAQIGTTRNAVIGKAPRIEKATGAMLFRNRPAVQVIRQYKPRQPRVREEQPKAGKVAPSMAGDTGGYRMPKVRLKYRPRETPTLKLGRSCGIVDVTGCKWPVGFDAHVARGHLFCNSELHDSRYCEFHACASRASYSTELVTRTYKQALHTHKRSA